MSSHQSARGFTLIEILIVIAIILILIAIALPNFLEAQTRAKVTKVKGEIRTAGIALEAYQTDWSQYPWGAELESLTFPAMPPSEPAELHLGTVLTSPVPYLQELPNDTFSNLFAEGADQGLMVPFHYTEEQTNLRLGDPALLLELTGVLYGFPRRAPYVVLSHGPDGDHDEFGDHHHGGGEPASEETESFPAIYAPTNGSKSSGDIYYFGPGIAFN
ncbi:MAG: prepilin-type N-terminal cleavage/methylation domain-containing protein [Candidatus Omnitrophica bacterium]|nr:prepilin-type N-terminal cleavage/methylation domain-containing protein [Candidatus Omnitrophota bacterium]MCA9415117.1 prepilin-type N-terminal cleavage/methylation domain-containing protein [Candidatus Omnitrophota bacterium]